MGILLTLGRSVLRCDMLFVGGFVMGVCLWRPEVNFECCSLYAWSTLFFEIESLIGLGVTHYSSCFSFKTCLHLQSADITRIWYHNWISYAGFEWSNSGPHTYKASTEQPAPQSMVPLELHKNPGIWKLKEFWKYPDVSYRRSLTPWCKGAAQANTQHLFIHLAKIWVLTCSVPCEALWGDRDDHQGLLWDSRTVGGDILLTICKEITEGAMLCLWVACLTFLFFLYLC